MSPRRFWMLSLAAAACANEASSPTTTSDLLPYARTYTVTHVDTLSIPFVRAQDGGCQQVNTGGWLSLSANGSYQLLLDHVSAMCTDAPGGGGDAIYQAGTYVVSSGTLRLRPKAGYGPSATGSIWRAIAQPGGGFSQASVHLTFGPHSYDLVALFQPPE